MVKWRHLLFVGSLALLIPLASTTHGFANGPILCPFRLLTGYECPTCGTTRSLGSLIQGDVVGALNNNPLGIVVAVAIMWFVFANRSFLSFAKRIRAWWDETSRVQQVFVVSVLCSALWLRAILL